MNARDIFNLDGIKNYWPALVQVDRQVYGRLGSNITPGLSGSIALHAAWALNTAWLNLSTGVFAIVYHSITMDSFILKAYNFKTNDKLSFNASNYTPARIQAVLPEVFLKKMTDAICIGFFISATLTASYGHFFPRDSALMFDYTAPVDYLKLIGIEADSDIDSKSVSSVPTYLQFNPFDTLPIKPSAKLKYKNCEEIDFSINGTAYNGFKFKKIVV